MKKKLFIMIVLAVILVTGTLVSSAEGITVKNPGIETVNSDGKPESWLEGAWTKTGATVFSADSEATYEGSSSAKIYNITDNDARFEQRIKVKAKTIYRISAYVKTENVLPQGDDGGANISILDTWVRSEYLYGSNDWTKVELYGKTDSSMTEFILCLRLGFYSAEASGIAYFDSVEVEEVEAAPAGVTVQDIKLFEQNTGTTSGSAEWDRRVEGDKFVKWVTAAFIVLLLGLYYFGVYSKKTLNDLENAGKEKKSYKGLILLIIGGLVLRYWAMVATPFYESDFYGCFKPWAEKVFEVGPGNFYVSGTRCDYPPLYILILYIVQAFNSLLGSVQAAVPGLLSTEAFNTISDALFIMPAVTADVIAAVMIYKVADKKLGNRMAMVLSAAYFLNPAIWFNSSSWGQVDSLSALAIVIMVYCLIEKKQLGAFIAFVLGLLMKPQMFIVSPILFFGVANDFIKVYKSEGGDLKAFFVNFFKNLGISLAIGLAVILLFMFDFRTFRFTQEPLWIFDLYAGTLGQYNKLSLNALNIYTLFGGNDVNIYASGDIPNKLFGFIPYNLFLYVGILVCVIPLFYFNFKHRKNKNLFLLASFILAATFMLLTKMHERYLFPAIITVLFAFIYLRDKRLLAIFGMMSTGSFINIGLTLYRYWIKDGNTYTLTSETITVDQPVGYVISAFNVLWFLFFAYVVYDICIREHVKDFASTIKGRLDAWALAPKQRLEDKNEAGGAKLNLKRADVIIILSVTILYGIFSFIGLGTTSFPESYWSPAYNYEYVIGDLGQTTDNAQYLYYAGAIGKGSFTVEVSADKENWTVCRPVDSGNRDTQGNVTYDYGHMFKWHAVDLAGNSMRYVRITSKNVGFNILEIGIVDKNMEVLPLTLDSYDGGSEKYPASNLFDEQDTIPDRPSYYNSMYFDEIYHARTGYEFVHGMETYETTHPQLGKVFMAWSIEIFGMNPFGWRFAGNVFGILMLPLVYLFAKLVFKKTWIAALAMGMMTFDGMHFVQTRIATIDVFGVFFIILMYLFMYKYYTMNFYKDKLSKTFIPLGLCGLAFGLGAASKWICLYAALGLAILLFYTLYKRFDEYIYAKKHIEETSGEQREQYQHIIDVFGKYTTYTLLFCVGFFVIIPAVIYVASYAYYVPHNQHLGYLEAVIENQEYMLSYHSGLSADTHPYRSSWYTWPVIARPTWYYNASLLPAGSAGTIAAFGSPIVWIGALIGTIAACIQGVIDRKKIDADPLNATEPIYNNRDLIFLLIGLASQFVPWIFVPRSTFIYHYFASVPFIIMLTALVFARAYRRDKKRTKTFIIWSLAAMAVVFAIYYPAWSGVVIPEWYRQLLRFPPSWYF